jgi:hypothetical protein
MNRLKGNDNDNRGNVDSSIGAARSPFTAAFSKSSKKTASILITEPAGKAIATLTLEAGGQPINVTLAGRDYRIQLIENGPGPKQADDETLKLHNAEALDDQLIEAVRRNQLTENSVKSLLERGADPNAIDREGNKCTTALMLASSRGNIRVAQALINAGANVNARNTDGKTALKLATENNHFTLVAILKKHNATE